jgi:hypothetical protein
VTSTPGGFGPAPTRPGSDGACPGLPNTGAPSAPASRALRKTQPAGGGVNGGHACTAKGNVVCLIHVVPCGGSMGGGGHTGRLGRNQAS